MNTNTNWSTPKKNLIAGINELRKALASGSNARLIKMRNEDCNYPIKIKNSNENFRAYEFTTGFQRSKNEILADKSMSEFQKYLSLNYKTCYGTQEAVNKYYDTGFLSLDNFKGIGVSHLVAVKDLIFFHQLKDNKQFVNSYQHFINGDADEKQFFDNFRLKQEHSRFTIKSFKRKLWVIELLDDNISKLPWTHLVMVNILRALVYPFKFIPRRSVLRMDKYKVITYRIGDVVNGLSIEIHVPKKFSFK